MSFHFIKRNVRIKFIFGVEREVVYSRELLFDRVQITGIDLGFAEEGHVRDMLVKEVFEVKNVANDALNVPGHYSEFRERFCS